MPAGNWYPGYNAQGYDVRSSPFLMAKGFASQPPTVTTPGTGSAGAGALGGTFINTTGYDCMVYMSASSVGTIAINGAALVGTAGSGVMVSAYVPAGQTIALSYTGNLIWKWLAV